MNGLTVLVVDDEPLARRRLVRLLARMDWVGRVEEAAEMRQACRQLESIVPDILLLDIQMPGGSGFDLIERLGAMPPVIVFVTAFGHHALRAFDANAIDYVTKPIDPHRFDLAMERARQAAGMRTGACRMAELHETIASLRSALAHQPRQEAAIWVKVRSERVRLSPDSILWFRSERDYVRIHVGGGSYLHHESLASLEKRFAPGQFLRIHRGAIVRRDAVERLKPAPFAALIAVLVDGTEVRVGRSYAPEVRGALGFGRPPRPASARRV